MKLTNAGYEISKIETQRDTAWSAWREIYYASFPEHERMSDRYFEDIFDQKAKGGAESVHLLAMSDTQAVDNPICIGYYEFEKETGIAILWYIATKPGVRGKGYGVEMYDYIRKTALGQGAQIFVFEVEIPEIAALKSAEAGMWAKRRIGWYEARGASIIQGIRYTQTVDSLDEETEMHLMTHNWSEVDSNVQRQKLKDYFGDDLELLS